MKAPQPIPYQGSKRVLAPIILQYFPGSLKRLVEPFAGSAAISVATALKNKADKFWFNDINEPLINLLKEIIEYPDRISRQYEDLWQSQIGKEKEFYLEIREKFNNTKRSDYFLYILSRCVKGAVRYNTLGEFNQGADNRRKGKMPKNMKREIIQYSKLLKGKVFFTSKDYKEVFQEVKDGDLIYMDPPYQGTSKKKDSRYFSGLDYNEFIENLHLLNDKAIPFIISYDGRTGKKEYGDDLPKELDLHKILIEVGRSASSTLLGNAQITYESLYLSNSLVNLSEKPLPTETSLKPKQLELL